MYIKVKRIFDVMLAIVLLIIASPIMIVAAIAVKLGSEGPLIFKQPRPGKDGKIFNIYKFRTLDIIKEKDGRMLCDEERVTRNGKILRKGSIDELPQLFNVLKNQMSFIGPRPLLVDYLKHYTPEQMRRHEVLPGISGWAQVNGRNGLDWEERFKCDVYYVDNISLSLDIKILFLTIYKVFARKDVVYTRDGSLNDFAGSTDYYRKINQETDTKED